MASCEIRFYFLSLYLYDNGLKSFKLPQLKQGASLNYIWISNQEVSQPRDLFVCIHYE